MGMAEHESGEGLRIDCVLDPAPGQEVAVLAGGETHLDGHDVIHAANIPRERTVITTRRREARRSRGAPGLTDEVVSPRSR
jgi:hypothetical protein